jgi:hypothetical protein
MSIAIQRPRVSPNLIERSFDLPFGYRATFIWRRADEPMEVHWSPDRPHIRKPRPHRKFLAAYQAARREFFEEVAAGQRRRNSSSRH